MPWSDFDYSVRTLDDRRLGKQRVETLQIMLRLSNRKLITYDDGMWRVMVPTLPAVGNGWSNHPAARMWRGHLWSLLYYQRATCNEWFRRGHVNETCWEKTLECLEPDTLDPYVQLPSGTWKCSTPLRSFAAVPHPPWLGDPDFHRSHRSNLLRKDPGHYTPKFPRGTPSHLEYKWPVP